MFIGGVFMNKRFFWFWMVIIAGLSYFTGEMVAFMMLFLILLTLNEINHPIKSFYNDWKNKN